MFHKMHVCLSVNLQDVSCTFTTGAGCNLGSLLVPSSLLRLELHFCCLPNPSLHNIQHSNLELS
jgi:hypothetical protein